MKSPETYFEWKEICDLFSKGDDTVLPVMDAGIINMNSGTADRFALLFNDAYKKRKQLWLEKFSTITQKNYIRSTTDFSVMISQAKSGLKSLVLFSGLRPLHTDMQKLFREDLVSFVGEVKKTLRENALRERSDHFNHMLAMFDNLDIGKVSVNAPGPDSTNSLPTKRKIIF